MVEMRAADQYAALAAAAGELPEVRLHLQQALNCLEGVHGVEYRSSVGGSCHGEGAANDLPANSVNRIRVEKAIKLLQVGITFHDYKPAHFTAEAVKSVLDEGTR